MPSPAYPLEKNSLKKWKAHLLLNNISIILFNTSWDLVAKWFPVGGKPKIWVKNCYIVLTSHKPYNFKFFKVCLPHILLAPFLNILPRLVEFLRRLFKRNFGSTAPEKFPLCRPLRLTPWGCQYFRVGK